MKNLMILLLAALAIILCAPITSMLDDLLKRAFPWSVR